MNIFYNSKSLNNTLVVSLKQQDDYETVNLSDDLVVFKSNNETIGFNLFNANKYIKGLVDGYLYPTNEIVQKINEVTKLNLMVLNDFKGFLVGQIKLVEPIPNTHLNICQVDIGSNDLVQIVCGAKNARVNLKVVAAVPNLMMPNGDEIKPSKLMNVASFGMLCSQKELNIHGFNTEGIIELNDQYEVGSIFKNVYSNLI